MPAELPTYAAATERLVDLLRTHGFTVDRVGHRFVHGGSTFNRSAWVDNTVLVRLNACCPLAPIHNPNSLSVIQATLRDLPGIPQYVAFDTAFHCTLSNEAKTYGLPYPWFLDPAMHKVGFHGLSYHDITAKTAAYFDRCVDEVSLVACHLGTGGSSVAAIRDGRSVDTSMGATPTAGLVMSTRCGDVDPMIPLRLADRLGGGVEEARQILNHASGLLGLSGVSSDIRDLLDIRRDSSKTLFRSSQPRVSLALGVYFHRLTSAVGAMLAAAGPIDALVFTDDVGLTSPDVRGELCKRLSHLGFRLDPAANLAPQSQDVMPRHAPGSATQILSVRNDEGLAIAREGILLGEPPESRDLDPRVD